MNRVVRRVDVARAKNGLLLFFQSQYFPGDPLNLSMVFMSAGMVVDSPMLTASSSLLLLKPLLVDHSSEGRCMWKAQSHVHAMLVV